MLTTATLDLSLSMPGFRAAPCLPGRQRAWPGAGAGRLEVAEVDGCSAVVTCMASSPLQLLAPRPRGRAAWIIAASHGGGLVAGDAVDLEIAVGPGATACLGRQAETKVYRPAGERGAAQTLAAGIGSGGLLALLPDPVSPFAGARYDQVQRFELEAGASLVVLDAVTAGRAARGERWASARFRSRNEIRVGGKLVLADGLRLDVAGGRPCPDGWPGSSSSPR